MISSVYFKKIAEGIASFYSIIGKYLSSRIDLTMHIINCVYANSINDYLSNSFRWI